jgi:hypothetical protein
LPSACGPARGLAIDREQRAGIAGREVAIVEEPIEATRRLPL